MLRAKAHPLGYPFIIGGPQACNAQMYSLIKNTLAWSLLDSRLLSPDNTDFNDSTVAPRSIGSAPRYILLCQTIWCQAGCVDALAEDKALLYCFWLVHRPPTETLLQLALKGLEAMSENPAAAWSACTQAGALYLMTYLLQPEAPPPTQKVTGSPHLVTSSSRHT